MSNFGADIFNQETQPTPKDGDRTPAETGEEPPADTEGSRPSNRKKATKKKASKKRSAKASEAPEDPQSDEANPGPAQPDGGDPAGAEPTSSDEPATNRRRRGSSRKTPADASASTDTDKKPRRSARTTTARSNPRSRSRPARDSRTASAGRAPSKTARKPASRPQTDRVGVLIDFDTLREEARQAGGELAFLKLIKTLTGNRSLCEAFCYTIESSEPGAPPPGSSKGLSIRHCADRQSAAVAMAIDAMGMIDQLDTLVLSPMPPNLEPLLDAMAQRGIAVEVASFTGEGPAGTQARSLGKNCLFVP